MCGLAGIISTEKTAFNINHFNILGTLNDERGGDSCGIFIDGQIDYGIKNTEMFRSFTTNIEYPKSASIALLHCRKASPGYPINLSQAQPVIIRQNNKVAFVLMHNGTISNINTLATKYLSNTDTYNLSDSQILAKIIYKCGYDVLEEYEGCAVLIMVDYRGVSSEVLIFKGNSCYNEAKTNYERPLYYMISDGKFYFSSMFHSLYCINNEETIYNFPTNQLCKIVDNNVYLVKNINRTKLKKKVFKALSNDYSYADSVCYNKTLGIYTFNGVPVQGEYSLYPSGYLVPEQYTYSVVPCSCFYFFNGRLLYNKDCYEFLKNIDDFFEDDVLPIYCPEVIDYFSYSPRMIDNQLSTVDENFNYVPYLEGTYVSLFSNPDIVSVTNGVVKKNYIYPTNAIEMFSNTSKGVFFNFEELEKQIMNFISSRLVNKDAI